MATTKLPYLRGPEGFQIWKCALRINATEQDLSAGAQRVVILNTVHEKILMSASVVWEGRAADAINDIYNKIAVAVGVEHYEEEIRDELRDRKWRKNESVIAYAREVQQLWKRAGKGENVAKLNKKLLKGLPEGATKNTLRAAMPLYGETAAFVVAIDLAYDKQERVEERPRKFQGKCHNCGRVGHRKSECRAKRTVKKEITCYKCKKPGHIATECRTGRVLRVEESVIVDSGATVSLMRKEVAERRRLHVHECKKGLSGIGGSVVVNGKVELEEFPGVPFYLWEGAEDIVLGVDAIETTPEGKEALRLLNAVKERVAQPVRRIGVETKQRDARPKLEWTDIESATHMTIQGKQQILSLLNEFDDVFDSDPYQGRIATGVEHPIDLLEETPISSRPYKVPIMHSNVAENVGQLISRRSD